MSAYRSFQSQAPVPVRTRHGTQTAPPEWVEEMLEIANSDRSKRSLALDILQRNGFLVKKDTDGQLYLVVNR